jgi:hypothetical protein
VVEQDEHHRDAAEGIELLIAPGSGRRLTRTIPDLRLSSRAIE